MATKAKKKTLDSKDKTQDPRQKTSRTGLPAGWEVSEEKVKEKKPKDESTISNAWLWGIFLLVFIGFVAAAFLGRAPPAKMQTTIVYGINISAPSEPISALKSLADLHIEGKSLDQTEEATNALLEIGTVIGTSNVQTRGGEYSLAVGATDRTGIFINSKSATIEGKNKNEFWTAVWTFTSLISNTPIDSEVPFYDVQNLLNGRKDVSLVVDLDNACPSYAKVISSASDIMQALGFRQATQKYTIRQYNESGDSCGLQFELTGDNSTNSTSVGPADCPVGDEDSFVVILRSSDANRIIVTQNGLVFLYTDCNAMYQNSVIARDLLAPDVLTGTRNFQMPTVI